MGCGIHLPSRKMILRIAFVGGHLEVVRFLMCYGLRGLRLVLWELGTYSEGWVDWVVINSFQGLGLSAICLAYHGGVSSAPQARRNRIAWWRGGGVASQPARPRSLVELNRTSSEKVPKKLNTCKQGDLWLPSGNLTCSWLFITPYWFV